MDEKQRNYVPKSGAQKLTESTDAELEARGYRRVTADDVTDLALLPKRFDSFAAEVKDQLGVVSKLILPMLTEIRELVKTHGDQLHDHARKLREVETDKIINAATIARLEAKDVEHDQQLATVTARLAVLELTVKSKPSRKKKRR